MENQEIKKAYDKLFDCYQKLPTQDGDQAIDMLIRSGVRFIDTIICFLQALFTESCKKKCRLLQSVFVGSCTYIL